MQTAEDWGPVVRVLGYKTEAEMLIDLYVNQKWSITKISKKIGYSKGNIRRRLSAARVEVRGRGGPQRKGLSRFNTVSDEKLFSSNIHKLSAEIGLSCNAISKERKRRKDAILRNVSNTERTGEVGGLPTTSSSSTMLSPTPLDGGVVPPDEKPEG